VHHVRVTCAVWVQLCPRGGADVREKKLRLKQLCRPGLAAWRKLVVVEK
jgi:hypothetical protein